MATDYVDDLVTISLQRKVEQVSSRKRIAI
jgi:hypothetical protein